MTVNGSRKPVTRPGSPVTKVNLTPLQCTAIELRRVLGGTPFFAGLSVEDVDRTAEMFRQTHFDADEVIQRSGDPADRLSIVAAGTVKLVRPTPDGQDVLLQMLHPGDFFGSLALLGDGAYSDDATAHTQCCILRATAQDFQALLERFPSVAMATLTFVAARLREAHGTIEGLSARPVEERVAATLLKLADRVGRQREGDILIDMPLSRQDLADMTGATVETVSRVMSDFRRAGAIASGRRWIAIVGKEHLEDIVAGSRHT